MMKLGHEHLVGLEYKHGSQDCYGLIRRFYKDNFEVGISNNIARLLAGAHFETDCGHPACKVSPLNPRNK